MSKSTVQQAVKPKVASPVSTTVSEVEAARKTKLQERRLKWRWNIPLLAAFLIFIAVVGSLFAASHWYFSASIASTFRDRAAAAEMDGDYDSQLNWLRRYSLMKPEENEVVLEMAIAAENGADASPPERRSKALHTARKRLGAALARMDSESADLTDLRYRLIQRQLQLGGAWCRDAEYQVTRLGVEFGEPRACKLLALALVGQVNEGTYVARNQPTDNPNDWELLAAKPVGDVLLTAVDALPGDMDCIAAIIGALENQPDYFSLNANIPSSDESRAEVADFEVSPALLDRVREIVAPLRGSDDSRAALLVHRFDLRFQESEELPVGLRAAANRAYDELGQLEDSTSEETVSGRFGYVPEYYWHYHLLLEASRVFAAAEPESVEAWYERLVSLRRPGIEGRSLEEAYLGAGLLQEAKGEPELAVEIWKEGIEQVNPDSLDLTAAIARVRKAADISLNRQSLVDLRKAIDKQTKALSLASERKIPKERQIEMRRRLNAAQWRYLVLDSNLQERLGNRRAAIKNLKQAMKGAEDVEINEWLVAVIRLGQLYEAESEQDQAARAFDFATEIAPAQIELRLQAARAWGRAGNQVESIRQWRMVATSNRIDLQVAAAEALFYSQLRLPPEDQDLSGVRSSVRRLEESIGELDPTNQSVKALARQLAMIGLLLPPEGVGFQDHLNSESFMDGVNELALANPSDAVVQQFAAERLAQGGNSKASELAFNRLADASGDNLTSMEIVRARIAADEGQFGAATKRLLERAKVDDKRRTELLELAAGFAIQGNLIELAYRSLDEIGSKNAAIIFRLSTLARALPEDSEFLGSDDRSTPMALSRYWEDQLKTPEGANPDAFWCYLCATRLINELESDPVPVERNDERLKEAKDLVGQIGKLRPSWGEGISLRGWIHSIEREPRNAVRAFREGIAAGDRSIQTRQKLWGQLVQLGQFDEAEEALEATARSTNVEVDKYGRLRIGIAQKKREFQRSVDLAEAEVKKRPDDFLSYIVLAGAASAAASEMDEKEKRLAYIQKARDAVNSAGGLARKNESWVYFARLLIEIAHGSEDSIRDEINRIEKSELPDSERWGLVAQGHEALGELQEALAAVEKVDQLSPTVQSQLAIAEISRKLRDSGREIEALRKAHDKYPKDGRVRSRLAQALLARDGENIDWDEVSELLVASPDVTPENRFLYSLMLLKQSDQQRLLQAEQTLREIYREQNRFSMDAGRVLAGLLGTRADDASNTNEVRQRCIAESREIHEALVRSGDFSVSDLYRYADFLIRLNNEGDWPRIRELHERLNVHPQGAIAAFEIKIKLDVHDGKQPDETAREFVESRQQQLGKSNVASIAGAYLMRFGLQERGLDWLKQAYESDQSKLAPYISAMNSGGMFEESANVASKHFSNHDEVQAAILLVETLFKASSIEMTSKYEKQISTALMAYGDHVPLLESLATLRLRNENYVEAIAMYNRILELDPRRLMTLNNLAMAFTELPGRASEGLAPIDRAIDLAGELPELLDTKGVVLLKAGRPEEAEDVFEQAFAMTDEPRFEFHLIMALRDQGKQLAAQKRWENLRLESLDVNGLVESERELLETLKVEYRSGTL